MVGSKREIIGRGPCTDHFGGDGGGKQGIIGIRLDGGGGGGRACLRRVVGGSAGGEGRGGAP